MFNNFKISLTVAAIFITSCGDGSGSKKESTVSPKTLAVDSTAQLPACDATNESQLVYLKTEAVFKTCTAGQWTLITIAGNTTTPTVKQQLVKTEDITAGATCEAGGKRILFGYDANSNGILDVAEITAANTQTICNGVKGNAGSNGSNGVDGLKVKYLYKYHVNNTASTTDIGTETSAIIKIVEITVYVMTDNSALYSVNGIVSKLDSASNAYSYDFTHTFIVDSANIQRETFFKITGLTNANIRYQAMQNLAGKPEDFSAAVDGFGSWSGNSTTYYALTLTTTF